MLQGRNTAQNLFGWGHADVVLGEVDASFQQGNQLEERLFDGDDTFGDGAFHLLRGNAGLVERGGVNQIAHCLCLGQVNPAIQVGAKSEFARFGQTRTVLHRALKTEAEENRRAVTRDFDDVFGRIGERTLEERDDHAINGPAVAVQQFCEFGGPALPAGLMRKSQD